MTGVSRPLTGMVSNWLISNVRGMKGTPCEGEPFAPLIQTGPGVERKHDYDTIMFLTGMLKLRIWGDRRWLRQVSGTNDRIWSVRYRWHLFSAGYRLVLCHGDTVRTGVTWCDPCGRSLRAILAGDPQQGRVLRQVGVSPPMRISLRGSPACQH